MYLTLESYKNDIYTLQVLSDILKKLKISIKNNPYEELDFGDWNITGDIIFKDGVETSLILRNEKNKEDINLTFISLDEILETDNKFDIKSLVLYKENGKKDEKIEISNYIYNISNSILEILENKQKDTKI